MQLRFPLLSPISAQPARHDHADESDQPEVWIRQAIFAAFKHCDIPTIAFAIESSWKTYHHANFRARLKLTPPCRGAALEHGRALKGAIPLTLSSTRDGARPTGQPSSRAAPE